MRGVLGTSIISLNALLIPSSLPAQAISFIQQNQITTGLRPSVLALADLNNDGREDLIVANQGAASLTVLRGVGNGFFQPLTSQATGISPSAVAVGDFNRDGRLDLAVANFASNNVNILLGTGNGTFRAFGNLAATGPSALAVGDFNGDGKLDLAIAETTSNTVSVFLGTGFGTFLPSFTATIGNRPVSIATADFNRDGKLDLAIANSASNDISILLGIGNGTFLAARTFEAGAQPACITVGDFDGNGTVDIAVANLAGFSADSVSLLLGLGDGAFLTARSLSAGSNASFIVAGDFNLDGKTDLAVASTGSGTVSIFLGLGNGFFLAPLDVAEGNRPVWISVADLNGDGKPDLLVADSGSDLVAVLINHSAAAPSPTITSLVSPAGGQVTAVAAGELVTLFGSNLGPDPPLTAQLSDSGIIASALGQTQVLFDGVAAPLLYAASRQVSAIVPYGVAGHPSTQVLVTNAGQISSILEVKVASTAPMLFTLDNSGQGQAAALNQDGSVNGRTKPAAHGSVVVVYATGAGETNPASIDGLVTTTPGAAPMYPVSATINGRSSQVLYAGQAPGLVSGVLQVNIAIPVQAPSGAVPIVLQVGSGQSQSGVTIEVE